MRSDMAKVIVERPRRGRMVKERKGYWKEFARTEPDEWRGRESISAHKGRTKYFNEHLAPLRRYLLKQAGRPWNLVYADICKNLRLDSVIQSHVRDHVFDYVVVDVVDDEGVLRYPCGKFHLGGQPLTASRWTILYVCPHTGILRHVKRRRRQHEITRLGQGTMVQHRRLDGTWFEVRLRPVPQDIDGCWEAVLEKPLAKCSPEDLTRRYGSFAEGVAVYALSKRPLKPAEARELLKRSAKQRK